MGQGHPGEEFWTCKNPTVSPMGGASQKMENAREGHALGPSL